MAPRCIVSSRNSKISSITSSYGTNEDPIDPNQRLGHHRGAQDGGSNDKSKVGGKASPRGDPLETKIQRAMAKGR
jgi:hypothetical protein